MEISAFAYFFWAINNYLWLLGYRIHMIRIM